MASGVKLIEIVKRFGKVTAVNNASIEFKKGELGVLLGPSGCGKTTLLRIIAGLERPDHGEVYIEDRNVTNLPPQKRDVAMVFQNYVLYPHMTVFDNMAYPLKARKLPKNEIRRRVMEVARLLEIEHLLDRKPAQLSGGQQQRVAIGRALVRNPKVFLMDEPLANLDARLRIRMRGEIRKLQLDLKATMIYVTHDQAEAMAIADKIVVMRNGVIQQVAAPQELFLKPANVFVARFIGDLPSNIIDGDLVERNGTIFVDLGFYDLKIPEDIAEYLVGKVQDNQIKVGIRPRDVQISKKMEPGSFKATVYLVETLGEANIVTLKVDDVMLNAVAPPGMFSIGDEVWVKFDINKIYFFDGKTEKSLL